MYARAAKYDETEEIENRHTTVKRQICSDGLTRLALKMDRERPVLRSLISLIVITTFFVPCVMIIVLKAVINAAKKICGYVQQEMDLFREFYEDDKELPSDEAGLFEGFIKGEDYEVCVQSKRRNNLSVWPLPLVTKEIFSRNPVLGSRPQCAPSQIYSSTSGKCTLVSNHESHDCVKIDASVKSSHHQVTNDIKKSRKGRKVQCKAVVTTIMPLSEIMAIMSQSKVKKDKRLKKSRKTPPPVSIAKKRSESEATDGEWSKQAAKKQRTKKPVTEENLQKFRETSKPQKKNKDKTSKKHRNSYTEERRSGYATPFIEQVAETIKQSEEPVHENKMMNSKRPFPVAPFNVQSTEESTIDVDQHQESLPNTASITELVSLMEQLHISPCEVPPCDVPERDISSLIPVVPDSESYDEWLCEGEYDLFPELQSMPEQVLQIIQMLP